MAAVAHTHYGCGGSHSLWLLQDVCVGNQWIEAICSTLLWSKLYNSRRARRFGNVLFNFVMPAFFVVQGLLILCPYALSTFDRLSSMIDNDKGAMLVGIVLRFLGKALTWIGTHFRLLVHERLWAPLASFMEWLFSGPTVCEWLTERLLVRIDHDE
jgi:hypothetical protein